MTKNNLNANISYMYKDGNIFIFMFYIDKFFVTRSDNNLIIWYMNYLQSTFDVVDLKIIQQYLGIDFDKTSQDIFIHQTKYT